MITFRLSLVVILLQLRKKENVHHLDSPFLSEPRNCFSLDQHVELSVSFLLHLHKQISESLPTSNAWRENPMLHLIRPRGQTVTGRSRLLVTVAVVADS